MIAGLHLLCLSLFPAVVLWAALRDATTYIIPNRISIILALSFPPVALMLGVAPLAIGVCLLVGLGALCAGVAMFALNWIGGGDAKLFAASALWLGLPALVPFLAWTAIAGGALATLLLLARKSPLANLVRGPFWVGRLLEPKADVPYGVAIAVGALVAFPASAAFRLGAA